PDFEQQLMHSLHMKLWANKDDLEHYGIPQNVEDLDMHHLISFNEDKYTPYTEMNWILHAGRLSKMPRVASYQSDSSEELYQAARIGYGIAQLSKEFLKLKGNSLVEVLPATEAPIIDLYFIYPNQSRAMKTILALHNHSC